MATPKSILLALAAGSVIMASPVMADYRSVKVNTEDLDLSRASGQAKLQARIDRAVKHVCAWPAATNLIERMDVKKCEANARSDAQEQAAQRIASYDQAKRNITLASD